MPTFLHLLRRLSPTRASAWKWLSVGIGVKRWLVVLLFGITLLSLGAAYVLVEMYREQPFPDFVYYLTLQFLPRCWNRLVRRNGWRNGFGVKKEPRDSRLLILASLHKVQSYCFVNFRHFDHSPQPSALHARTRQKYLSFTKFFSLNFVFDRSSLETTIGPFLVVRLTSSL